MKFTILRSNLVEPCHEAIFEKWMRATNRLLAQFYEMDGYSPLKDNERSGTGVFLAGAVKAGFLAVTEFSTDRRSRADGRKWGSAQADLWLIADNHSFAFEFKLCNPLARWNRRLYHAVDDAFDAVSRLRPGEAKNYFACVIAPNFTGQLDNHFEQILDDGGTHYAVRFGVGSEYQADALFFQKLE